MLRGLEPTLLLAGPAFNAGRYGVACGELCRRATAELGIAAVTGMYEENPGVELYRRDVMIVRTGPSAVGMRQALEGMLLAKLAGKPFETEVPLPRFDPPPPAPHPSPTCATRSSPW